MKASRFAHLFQRYQSGQSTPEEEREFLEMVAAADRDEELKEAISEMLAEEPAAGLRMPEESSAAVLEKILEDAPRRRSKTRYFVWAAVAAGIVVLLGIGLLLQTKTGGAGGNDIAQNTISPGKERAVLVLDDGREIDLERSGKGAIGVQQGLQAQLSGNTLQYDTTAAEQPTFNTIRTPRGGQYRVVLPDGSKVWLNAASSIRFPTVFKAAERKVEVEGEVYFEVAPRPEQPFIVKAGEMQVQVTGTHFNIMAYPDEDNIETTLLEGGVRVSSNGSEARLTPGLQAVLARNTQNIKVRKADTDRVVAWKEGRFEFRGNISGIMRQIARWYDVQVVFKGDVEGRNFGGAISRTEKIEDVLKMLEMTGSIQFEINNNTVTVMP
ncbi:FecR family protein [Chitinophaga sp.]|uniref:FecR family protein n=1 Tax=Chitinophaga sp. TaxID=1869181 RepID=UPI00261661E4|nr:FecR family protein [uncultured Chitinophaga sp.]